jgi:hypothetical protein
MNAINFVVISRRSIRATITQVVLEGSVVQLNRELNRALNRELNPFFVEPALVNKRPVALIYTAMGI